MKKIFTKTDVELKESFSQLSTRKDVAEILELEEKSLRYFLYGKKPENMYKIFKIKKHNGELREINAPIKELKTIQRKLAYIFQLVYKVKPSVYGFVPDKNIKDNAAKHIKKRVILNIDLEKFFNQIHFGRIRGMLMSKPYSIGDEAATVIAQLSCFKGVLPQGAPSSPILTNMICAPLDTQLTRLAKKYKLVYTRYADDITFSTRNANMPDGLIAGEVNNLTIGRELSHILEINGFRVNLNKVFLNNNNVRQEVTGLVANKFPNIKREYIKLIRSILYHSSVDGIYKTAKEYVAKGNSSNSYINEHIDDENYKDKVELWFKSVLKGKVNFIKEIRGKNDYVFLKYAYQLNKLYNEEIFNVEPLKELLDKIEYNVVILESMEDDVQGSGFFLKDFGLVTSSNHEEVKLPSIYI